MDCRPGDILLYRISQSSNWIDRLIGWGQRVIRQAPSSSSYCHVALVGPNGSFMYEAKWPRIHNVPIALQALEKNVVLETYRVKNITADQIKRIVDFAQSRVGRRYDLLALLTFGYLQVGPAAVCSQFVWEAFTAAGICLCPWNDLESPDDIAASELIEKVA